jgi:vacuolar-type H+-ATPase subunit E/Vma4
MTESREHWDEVARRFESLALKLKLHYEENAAEDRAELDSALRTIGESLRQSVRSLDDAVRDPAVRQDADDLATSLGDALSRTFSEVGSEIRDTLTQPRRGT